MLRANVEIYLRTQDTNLDDILVRHGNIRIDGGADGGAPIILILGAAGTGKTTLALQIATRIASCKDKDQGKALAFFYSLEQSSDSLKSTSRSFGFSKMAKVVDLAKLDGKVELGKINLCHLSPLPIVAERETSYKGGAAETKSKEEEAAEAFEYRFQELSFMLSQAKDKVKEKGCIAPVVFLDSLNAIATSFLERNDIYRLFALFRSQNVPAVITAERHDQSASPANAISEYSRFLADVVIELTKEPAEGHILRYLEVSKSRLRLQAVDRHLYKIRICLPSPDAERKRPMRYEVLQDNHSGLVVYKSVATVVSTARKQPGHSAKHPAELIYTLCPGKKENPLYRLMDTGKIKAGACFSLMGPPGTHKLALGMNLATGYISGKDPRRKLLIVSFGGRSPMDLHGVAWFDFRFKWAAWNRPKVEFYRKCWSAEFAYNAKFYNKFGQAQSQSSVGAASKDSGRAPRATQLVFNLGHLTPEECLDAIDKMTATDKYSGVLLSDTASICTGFPLLRKSPLFLPALIDLFRKRDLVSVCLGVQEPRSPEQEMDFALESCADYRIRHSHYPDYNELAKAIVKHAMGAKDETLGLRSEQLVSVVLDNVTGKHYGRDPKWLWVKPGRNSPSPASPPKELCCGPVDEWIEVNKKNKAKSRPK